MKIPPYWNKGAHTDVDAKGKKHTFCVWGWSFDSLAKAKEHASSRARQALDAWMAGSRRDSYDYLDHPLKEEIVQAVGPKGQETAVITRNRYGALVLNAASVCFVDVDFPRASSRGLLDGLLCLFSSSRRQARASADQQASLQSIRDWAKRNPRRSFRLYQTAAGLRLLFTDRLYDPTSDEVRRLLEELGSDPLYRRLTLKQDCFRARLTPKPWRCGCRRPPIPYPWDSPAAEQDYRAWQRQYEARCGAYGVCRLVEEVGAPIAADPIAAVIHLHDQHACRGPEAKLA